ncbi:MAG: diacylglycerol kinase family lipid kinase [Bacillota bacterium]
MQFKKTAVVVNPLAGNGKAGRCWPDIAKAFEQEGIPIVFKFTQKAGDATAYARSYLQEGYNLIVAVGGDGTANEVINGFFEHGQAINREAAVAFISTGSGSDLNRTLGTPKNFAGMVKHIASAPVRSVDLGKVTYTNNRGIKELSYFINVAGLGLDGDTAGRVNRTSKKMGGFFSFFWATVISLILYRNQHMSITVDDNLLYDGPVTVVVAANGRYFGGGMKIAPWARMDDGLFDLVILHNLSKMELLLNLPSVYQGGHVNNPKITFLQGKSVKISSKGHALLNLDGEQPGKAPVEMQIMPLALNIKS